MKLNQISKLLFALLAIPFVVACSDSDEAEPTPQPSPAPVIPEVTLTAGEATTTALSFTLSSKDAETVKWLCYEKSQSAPELAEVLAQGTDVEPNKSLELRVEELTPSTAYVLVAAAMHGEQQVLSNRLEMTTMAEEVVEVTPTISLEAVSEQETSLTFRLTSADAQEVKWVLIEKGSRTVNAQQVLQNGTSAEANTTVEITADALEADTEYEIYAVAKHGENVVMAEMLAMKTIYVAKAYTVNATEALSMTVGATNYFITFTDEATNFCLDADFYIEEGHQYLPSGTYTLGEMGVPGSISTRYTRFLDGTDAEPLTFVTGSITVEATPNEQTREVTYTINGTLSCENGDTVELNFEGQIEGIAPPEVAPEIPDVPEGYIAFVPHPDTQAPFRRKVNGEIRGEYVLVFTDKDWGELILDIYADPATCDNGNGYLPEGTYSIAAGTMEHEDFYSQVTFYEPEYWFTHFTTCEVTVTHTGDIYTITVHAAGIENDDTDLGIEKKIWMSYTGEINSMTRE